MARAGVTAGVSILNRSRKRKEKALQDIFAKADKNSNNKIFVSDFLEIMELNDITIEEDELAEIGKLVDENGEIKRADFITFTRSSDFWKDHNEEQKKAPAASKQMSADMAIKRPVPSDKAEAAFRIFDKDNDGFITKDEFAQVSKKLTPAQVAAVFDKFDTNNDGQLSLGEFRRLMDNQSTK